MVNDTYPISPIPSRAVEKALEFSTHPGSKKALPKEDPENMDQGLSHKELLCVTR